MPEEADIAKLAKSMERIAERITKYNDVCPFTDEEIEQIKRAARLVEWFDTLGWLGKQILGFTAAIILLISQWERIVAWLREWLAP